MKPIKLTFQAFGTFLKKTEIDFERLSKNGVFLISGNTGSGKTTIFDAICYALYSEANGEDRQHSLRNDKIDKSIDFHYFRSKCAEPTQDTFVELIFECFGKRYKIYRCPYHYEEPTRLKNGKVKKNNITSILELTMPNGQVIEKSNEVEKAILNIVGLNAKQFKQIIMIAQGEFKNFLTSSSIEKGNILNSVFDTQKFEKFTSKLKDKMDIAEEEYINSKSLLVNDLLSIRYDNSWSFADNFESWKLLNLDDKDKDIQLVLNPLKDYIEMLSNEMNETVKSLESLNLEINELTSEINLHETMNSNIKNRDRLLLELNTLKSQQGEIDGIKSTIQTLDLVKSIESDYLNYKKSIQRVKDLNVKISNLKSNLETITNAISKLTSQKAEISKKIPNYIENLDNISMEFNNILNSLNYELKEITRKGLEIKSILDSIKSFKVEKSKLEESRKVLISQQIEYENIKNKYNQMEDAYNSNILGIYAERLQEGMKCMLCGSTHHPDLAKKCVNVPSMEEIKSLKIQVERFGERFQSLLTDFSSNQTKLDTNMNTIIDSAEKFGVSSQSIEEIQTQLEVLKNSLGNDYKVTSNRIKSIQKDIQTLQDIDGKLSNFSRDSISIKTSLQDTSKLLDASIAESNDLKSKYFKSLEENSIGSETEYLQLLHSYSTNYNVLKSRVTQFENSLLGCSSRLAEYSKIVGDSVFVDTNELHTKLDNIKTLQHGMSTKKIRLNDKVEFNSKVYNRVSQGVEPLLILERNYQDLKHLYDISNGSLKNATQKIAFVNYVQTYYFEKILQSANSKLQVMSNGVYSLIRSDSAISSRAKTGLEVQVYDATIGTTRLISTLSGGELFMASLSIALGLSEVVQQQSGNIKLEAMFIDEGFGTLDSGSLEQAISIIDKLATDNRIVGIISHVDRLKEHITNKLYVEKSQNISKVYYDCD